MRATRRCVARYALRDETHSAPRHIPFLQQLSTPLREELTTLQKKEEDARRPMIAQRRRMFNSPKRATCGCFFFFSFFSVGSVVSIPLLFFFHHLPKTAERLMTSSWYSSLSVFIFMWPRTTGMANCLGSLNAPRLLVHEPAIDSFSAAVSKGSTCALMVSCREGTRADDDTARVEKLESKAALGRF